MIEQVAVKIDGQRIEDPKLEIPGGTEPTAQVGKRKFAQARVA